MNNSVTTKMMDATAEKVMMLMTAVNLMEYMRPYEYHIFVTPASLGDKNNYVVTAVRSHYIGKNDESKYVGIIPNDRADNFREYTADDKKINLVIGVNATETREVKVIGDDDIIYKHTIRMEFSRNREIEKNDDDLALKIVAQVSSILNRRS